VDLIKDLVYAHNGMETIQFRRKMLGDKNRSLAFKAGETTLNSEHVRTQNFLFEGVGGSRSQWRTEGSLGFNPPPRNSEGHPKSCQTQPDCENC